MNIKKYNVIDRPDLIRESCSNAILYTDKQKLEEYKSKNNLIQKHKNISKEIFYIKEDLKDIKENLNKLINFINGEHNEKSKDK
jgi:hypothetical protein